MSNYYNIGIIFRKFQKRLDKIGILWYNIGVAENKNIFCIQLLPNRNVGRYNKPNRMDPTTNIL